MAAKIDRDSIFPLERLLRSLIAVLMHADKAVFLCVYLGGHKFRLIYPFELKILKNNIKGKQH